MTILHMGRRYVPAVRAERAEARVKKLEAEVRKLREALTEARPFIAHFKGGWSTHTHGQISVDELLSTIDAALSPAPDSGENTPRLCDCERGHSGFGLAARVCDCPRPAPDSGENTKEQNDDKA